MNEYKTEPGDDQVYEEREAVAIFPDETSLNNAIDELMQAGLRRDSLSLMADAKFVPGGTAKSENVKEAENKDFVEHADYVSPDARTEGLAALAGAPVYVAAQELLLWWRPEAWHWSRPSRSSPAAALRPAPSGWSWPASSDGIMPSVCRRRLPRAVCCFGFTCRMKNAMPKC